MQPEIEGIFDEVELRYPKSEELRALAQYVSSLPSRLDTYRQLRDQELAVMQWVADQLELEMPNESVDNLERCLKNALLMLRYCSLGMLQNDPRIVQERFINWVTQQIEVYNTQRIDANLYRLLNQRLNQSLDAKQMSLLNPMLSMAQSAMLPTSIPQNGLAIGW